jgi:hypothetical protein
MLLKRPQVLIEQMRCKGIQKEPHKLEVSPRWQAQREGMQQLKLPLQQIATHSEVSIAQQLFYCNHTPCTC